MTEKPSYNPNSPYWLSRSRAALELRVEKLRLREEIAELDRQIEILNYRRSANPHPPTEDSP